MSWRTLFCENYLPGDLCSGLIICWRKSSGEMSPGEKFLGEKCDEFEKKKEKNRGIRNIINYS